MGFGIDAAKNLLAQVASDPSTARAELIAARDALQMIIFAFDRAETEAREAYVAKVMASFQPERDAAIKASMTSAWAAFEAAAAQVAPKKG